MLPSKLNSLCITFYSKLWIVLIAYCGLSVGCLFFFIPSLPETIDSVHLKLGVPLNDPVLNDKASGIYNAFYFLGAIIAPPLGGLLNDYIDFRKTNDVMAIFSFIFTISYFIFNVLFC